MDLNAAIKPPQNILLEDFAKQITNEIMTKCEKQLIYKITESEFPYISREDKEQIYAIALRNSVPQNSDILSVVNYNRRKALIEESAVRYLGENSYIIISGFINFRLEEYKNELKKLCQNAMEEYSAIKEYDEFLNMLHFFVSVQAPKEPVCHIVKKNGGLRILNKRHKDVTELYSKEFAFSMEDFTDEDIALSALITIAPDRIIIHDCRESKKIYETIAAVFSNVEFTISST